MQQIKKYGIRFVGVVVLLVGVWALYHQIATVRSAEKYPAPGEMVDVGDRRLHMLCRGNGDGPTVVLVSGLSAISYYAWPDIAVPLSKETRTCLYDRAGYGWSDPFDGELDLDIAVADLARIVDAAGGGKPVILVGHSYGGLLVRQYALKSPE
ncbi:alpha/beta fold hydrolase, partial [Marinobacter aromaticivorans]